ncbi:MAG: hypothetical protein CL578_17530 [Alteromonadaceae bacterium]|jgi:DNA helicase-4|uniref:UvrD-like helicase ATP-binding domain-containing protein n=2 Tax=Paraglaciecola TaxID=1621534 RepID=K6ZTE0_9ALTE|nr:MULTISPECIES: UvrD-helicase domain-containing protein [Paraglaciecola]MBN26833.1 hypothetical protein [Alteromonadaceae bacterium]GAC05670.1 hypothetical protein GAGA_2831 [Paraglaciecola agarilytica NO2]GAC26580.1 hypothetical protein GMES_4309 [Paraglaciecola mesophila KMM 241]|tara:strand:+ start:6520 stop:6786 length:267 start_codon:yes stop_codon:yes gene_type:complete
MNLPENKQPNQEQRQLKFSSSRNTLTLAGAGSGKTTSPINQLSFLHTQCKIPLEELTVSSFTRASVAELSDEEDRSYKEALKRALPIS